MYSNVDFESFKDSKKLKVLVIGDSYVEAIQVSNEDTFHDLINDKNIQKDSNKKFISTSIASSGTQPATYIANLKFASQAMNLEDVYVVIVITANDFEASFARYTNNPIGFYFDYEKILQFHI